MREGLGAVADRPAPHALLLALKPTERRLSIATDDPRVAAFVAATYAAHVDGRGGAASDRAVLLSAVAPPSARFGDVALPKPGSDPRSPWRSPAYIVDQFVWRALAKAADWLPLYGALAVVDGGAVLLIGPGEIGKTTLGLALIARGARLLGDEMAVLHRFGIGLEVAAIRRALSVRAAALELLGSDELSRWVRAGKAYRGLDEILYFADPPQAGPAGVRGLPLVALFALQRSVAARPGAARLTAARAAALVARAAAVKPQDLAMLAALARRLAAVPAYELHCGEPHATAALVERLLA